MVNRGIVGVMRFLLANILGDFMNIPTADGKGRVRTSPLESRVIGKSMVHEMRRNAFELLHQSAHGLRRWERKQKMNMIGHAVDSHNLAALLDCRIRQAIEQSVFVFRFDQWQAIPRRPNKMEINDHFIFLHPPSLNQISRRRIPASELAAWPATREASACADVG